MNSFGQARLNGFIRAGVHQRTEAEVTVALQLNQGTPPKTGCYRFRSAFLVTFFSQKKWQRVAY